MKGSHYISGISEQGNHSTDYQNRSKDKICDKYSNKTNVFHTFSPNEETSCDINLRHSQQRDEPKIKVEAKKSKKEGGISGRAQGNVKVPKPTAEKGEEKIDVRIKNIKVGELKCMQANAESLMNKMDEFKLLVDDEKPDIIGITETWAKEDFGDEFYQLNGYNCLRNDNSQDIRGGVMIYYKAEMDVTLCKEIQEMRAKDSIWVWVKYEQEKVIVGCIYRKGTSSEENNTRLFENIALSKQLSDKVLIMGDLNFPEIDWKNNFINDNVHNQRNLTARSFLSTLEDAFLVQHVMEQTRARGENIPSCLDLIITESEESVRGICYLNPLGNSDHCVLTWKYLIDIEFQTEVIKRKCYYRGDYKRMKMLLNRINWRQELRGLSLNDAYNRFREIVLRIEDECIPTIEEGGQRSPKPPWLNRNARKAARRKAFAYRRFQGSRSYFLYREFIKERDKSNKILKKARREFEKKLFKEVKKNPKALYRYLNSGKQGRVPICRLRRRNLGTETLNDKESAEELNDFFHSVFVREEDSDLLAFNDFVTQFMNPETEEPFHYKGKVSANALNSIDLNRERVLKALKDLNPNKTPGPDGLHPKVLKEVAESICDPVYYIFLRSLETSEVPDFWELANITALFKGGDRSDPSNYRPVSLTSVLCKTLEKIIREEIVNHIDTEGILSENQHGFTNGRSCLTNLLETFNDWFEMFDNGHPVDTVFLDFRKAFDRVPHARLLFKLRKIGITGQLLSWIECFLKNRKQRVVLNKTESSWKPVVSGVPQGSVLGPVLFLIYINDLPDYIKSSCKIFADDTKVYSKVESMEEITGLQNDLENLVSWSEIWLLSFNAAKCKVMHIGRRNHMADYHMGETRLQVVEEEKDLGVLTSNSLKFGKHIAKAAAAANKKLGLLKHTFRYWTEESLSTLYKVYVRPHLEYCVQACAPVLRRDINVLEQVQRRATKLVPSLKNLPYEERLRRLNLTTLEERRERGDMIETFKILKNFDKIDPRKFFTLRRDMVERDDGVGRGHHLRIFKRRTNTVMNRKFFSHRIVDKWNSLPENVVDATSVNNFKDRYDRYIENNREEQQALLVH